MRALPNADQRAGSSIGIVTTTNPAPARIAAGGRQDVLRQHGGRSRSTLHDCQSFATAAPIAFKAADKLPAAYTLTTC